MYCEQKCFKMTTFGATLPPGNGNGNGNSNVGNIYDDYFSSSNFTARRIIQDIKQIKTNTPEFNDLPSTDQEAVINEHFMPHGVSNGVNGVSNGVISEKLPLGATSVYPRLKFPMGQKVTVIEDTAGSQGEDLDSASSSCVS